MQNIFEKEKVNLADAAPGSTKYSRGTWTLIFKASKRWKSVNWNIITDIERTWKMKQKIKKNVSVLLL